MRFYAALLGCLVLFASAAWSSDFARTEVRLQEHKTDNYVLFADEVINNNQTDTQIARGNVQIITEPYILLADEVTYSKSQDLMTARGHVRLMQVPQPQAANNNSKIADNPITNTASITTSTATNLNLGPLASQTPQPNAPLAADAPTEVLFTDYLEMTSDTTKGSLINARMLFSDNSRLVARNGKRYADASGNQLEIMHDVIYSPCDLCKSDPARAPLWQMQSSTFVHDTDAQKLRFYNATMDFYGIPAFYTPYFDMPDPSVRQAPGFLAPEYLTSSYVGSLIRTYYYYPFSPTDDITVEMSEATSQGPLLGLEWRERLNNAQITMHGAVTDSDLQTANGDRGDQGRGFISGTGRWDINSLWRAGFDLDYVSDPNFLQQYKYDYGDDILTNRLYAERFQGRSYGSINAYAFQDIRPGSTGDQPNLLPYITYSNYGKPGGTLGGRWGIETSFLGVSRPYGGQSMQRLSGNFNWERNWFTSWGLKNTLTAQAREDIYQVQNADGAEVGVTRAGASYSVTRFAPTLNWQSSIPFIKTGKYLQYQFEPIIALTATPRIKNAAIPDEDSQDVELDATNLFSLTRYPGLDRLEDGERVTYGLRTGFTNRDGGYFSIFGGQSNQLNGNDTFPVSSGLKNSTSDLVGQITAAPSKYFDADYRIRADHDTLAAQRHEASVNAGPDWLRVGANYAFLKHVDPTFASVYQAAGVTVPRQQIAYTVTAKLDQYWQVGLADTEDLDHEATPLITAVSLKYIDECFSILFTVTRDHTQQVGVPSGNSFYITFGFKNLGNYSTPTFNSLSNTNKTQ